jgi:uncharacterized surface protein with fasciclin (FAS1) repeats
MKKVLMAFGLALTSLISFSQSTVVDVIVNSEDHTLLEAAVVSAGLVDALSDTSGTFTVFAPTDDAFIALAYELNVEVEDLLALPNLTDILLYHVLPEVYLGEVLLPPSINSMLGTLLPEEPMYIQSDGMTITINGVASVTVADLITDNGVVHVIDAVVFPPGTPAVATVWDWIEGSDIHNYLEAAVIAGGLQSTLEGEGTFTVFAPTDDAFVALATTLGVEVTDLLVLPNLTDILLYHVLGTTVMSTDLYDGLEATTVGGGTLTVGVGETVTINGTATVVLADLEAQNGVVHVIDEVLLDNTTNSVGEIQNTQRPLDNNYYNVMGQRIDNLLDLPFGSLYIYNGKKYIMTQE